MVSLGPVGPSARLRDSKTEVRRPPASVPEQTSGGRQLSAISPGHTGLTVTARIWSTELHNAFREVLISLKIIHLYHLNSPNSLDCSGRRGDINTFIRRTKKHKTHRKLLCIRRPKNFS